MSVFCICKPVEFPYSDPSDYTSKIFQYRDIILKQSKFTVFSVCRDMIFISLPSVNAGLDHARELIIKSNIPISVAIGKDELFEAADGSLWGKGIDDALTLLFGSKTSEILLTDNAIKDL